MVPSNFDESAANPMAPGALVEHLALMKARDVARQYPGALVLGADTIVVAEGKVLGKPRNRDHAIAMLEALADRTHEVMTGVALLHAGQELVSHEVTAVRFGPMTAAQIERYVDSGEPMDKAGAYAIQGRAAGVIQGINGDYSNVVGLPIYRTVQMLSRFGIEVL